MAKREFLLQAHKYKPTKHDISGWFMSEKLDGMRCFWDSGITRGDTVSNVPWANTAKDKREFISTGLWTRKGKPIFAPSWWLDQLPTIPLDGELFVGRGERQTTMSYVRKHNPIDSEWREVTLNVFDAPWLHHAIFDGRYYDNNCDVTIIDVTNYLQSRGYNDWYLENEDFYSKQIRLQGIKNRNIKGQNIIIHEQLLLSVDPKVVSSLVNYKMDEVLNLGGEGLVFRNPNSLWQPQRSHDVLKLKPYLDSEATVIGYVSGKETDRGSKLRGLLGALIVEYQGKDFELSGFTDQERILVHEMDSDFGFDYAWDAPGERMPITIMSHEFPRGSIVTFKYRELSKAGIPIEASYYRKHLE